MKKIDISPLRCVIRLSIALLLFWIVSATKGVAGGAAGAYLYASEQSLQEFKGSLQITFAEPGDRLVVAYGHRNRKLRQDRRNTTEKEREIFKPVRAQIRKQGRIAFFPHLAPDFYDIIIVDAERMRLYEGLQLYQSPLGSAREAPELLEEVEDSLLKGAEGRLVGGWEAFFDAKDFIRFETDDERGGALVQQMRVATAFAESGAVLKGSIHSIDICWVEQALKKEAGWRVLTRQQLYRDELPRREFFQHAYVPELSRIRVGVRDTLLGPIALPVPPDWK